MRAFLLLLVCALGVATSPAIAKCPRSATTANYDKPGPYGVGQTTITFVDTHRGTPAHGSVAASISVR